METIPSWERFIRINEVIIMVGLSKTEIYRQSADGRFPKSRPYPKNKKIRFWLYSEILDWMQRCIDQYKG